MLIEKRFDFLVEAWCKCLEFILLLPCGYALVMERYGMALFVVLLRAVEGLPIRGAEQEQGRRKEALSLTRNKMQDEVRLAALRCLIVATPLDEPYYSDSDLSDTANTLSDIERDAETTGLRVKAGNGDENKEKDIWNLLTSPKNEEIIAQIIMIPLEVVKEASLVTLRTSAMDGVVKGLRCLKTPQRVAKLLPGIIAGLTQAMTERGLKEHHGVLVKALKVWRWIMITVFKDSAQAGQPIEEAMSKGSTLSEALMGMYKANTPSTAQQQSSGGYGTEAWSKKAEKGLRMLFREISSLRAHSHWMVRLEFGRMAFSVLKDCQGLIAHRHGESHSSELATFLLETLIGCAQDDYNQVSGNSRISLEWLTKEFKTMDLTSVGKEIMRKKLIALPRVLHGADETTKQNSIRMAQGLVFFLGSHMESIVNHHSLVSYVQPWISVLSIEQLDQHNMHERGGILDGESDLSGDDPSSESERWKAWIQSRKGSGRKFGFPRRIHQHLREHLTSTLFMAFLRQIGSTTEINAWAEELITRLQQDSRGVHEHQGWFDTGTVSCVLMLNQLLLGASRTGAQSYWNTFSAASESKGSKKKYQRRVRRVARGILEEYLAVMIECSQISLDMKSWQEGYERSSQSGATGLQAKKLALTRLLGMEDEGFDDGQPEARVYDYNIDEMLQCLLLEGIATVAVVLGGQEFEMELVHVLYILLERLGDQDSALVRDTAEATLEHVAFVCGHDSVGDLIQANYDYVIQQVSQKIAFLSSNPKTPQVLCALVRVVGFPAINMLEDSVTEIFEALDHWKSQEDQVGEGLLKSLSEIVKVMAQASSLKNDESASGLKRDTDATATDDPKFSAQDKPSVEVTQFARTYRIMVEGADNNDEEAEKLRKETENMTPEEIRDYFLKLAKDAQDQEAALFGERGDGSGEENADEDGESLIGDLRKKTPKPPKEASPVPLTKHQALCFRILDKAGYFLTASSPRLRILALEIIQSAIVVLKDRPLELNQAIHAFWPSIVGRVLKRSDMDVIYVSLRAIEVITVLAENCSDFLGRHLLDDIWPFILKAMQAWVRKSQPKGIGKRETMSVAYKQGSTISSQGQQRQQRTQGRREPRGKVFTMEHRLQMATLESVSKLVQRLRIPVQQVWEMLLQARDMMVDVDGMLHWEVRQAAAEVIRSMAVAGHGDCVFVALDEVQQQSGEDGSERDGDEEEEGARMCADILAFMEREGL